MARARAAGASGSPRWPPPSSSPSSAAWSSGSCSATSTARRSSTSSCSPTRSCLILSDVAKLLWGTQQKSVSRPPGLTGSLSLFGATIPHYNLFIILLGPAIALGFWFVLQRTRVGRLIRAAALDRETLGALGVNVNALYTGVFVLASFLGGLGGALITPDAGGRARHGHRDDRRGVRGRGHRRPRARSGERSSAPSSTARSSPSASCSSRASRSSRSSPSWPRCSSSARGACSGGRSE